MDTLDVLSHSVVPDSVTPWTIARQVPLSMGFSRQYWSGLPFPPPGNVPNPGIEPGSFALQADCLLAELPEKPQLAFDLMYQMDSQSKLVTRNKEGHYEVKVNHKEDITNVIVYVPNIGETKYFEQILAELKGKIDSNTVRVGNFNISLLIVDKLFRQKISKETTVVNNSLVQLELIEKQRPFHSVASEHTLLTVIHRPFSRIDNLTLYVRVYFWTLYSIPFV